jgi:hypothetical protein
MRNPIGNQQDEIQRLQEKSSKIASNINSHALSRTEAKLAYEAFFIPAMRYSLAVTSINQVDFETIQRKATTSLLAFLGYNRHMPREVIFGSQKYQGLGLRHLYDIQGTDGSRLLLQELNNTSSKTHTMLSILLDAIQQEAGISRPILEDTRPLQYIEWGWIPSIRDFLHHINAKITNANEGLPIYRERDSLIMDSEFLGKASRKEALLIHRCRLALQVECLSDICTSDGRQIDKAWLVLSSNKPSRSKKRWPRQEDPGPEASWSIWQKFLIREYSNGNSYELRNPLGKWLALNTTREHLTYYSAAQGMLWKRVSGNCWKCHRLISRQRRTCLCDARGEFATQHPPDFTPLDIVKEELSTIITRCPSNYKETLTQQASNMTSAISARRGHDILFHGTKLTVNEEKIKHLCTKSSVIDIASDGSHDQVRGIITYGWVIAVNEVVIAEGKGPAEGHPLLVESFRAEAYGLASAAAFLKVMMNQIRLHKEKIKWFCHLDNKALIKRMESYTNDPRTAKWEDYPDIDITDIAYANLQGITIQYKHIKGHQKESTMVKSFSSKLNDMADALAMQQQRLAKHQKYDVTIPHKHLKIKDMVVTRDSQRMMMEAASRIPLQQFYKEKYNWSKRTFETIHWDLQYKVLSGYDINDQRRILKFVHNWLPTNKRLHREKASSTQ